MKTLCDCGHIAVSDGFSTGYGIDIAEKKICFECCGKRDAEDLIQKGGLVGYLVKEGNNYYFTNWPATLKIRVLSFRKSWHNMTGKDGRTDFWFMFKNQSFHGVNIGHNSQVARVKRVK